MGWGYRVYTLETFDDRVAKDAQLSVDDVGGQDLASVIECLASKHLQGDKLLRGKPKHGRLGLQG